MASNSKLAVESLFRVDGLVAVITGGGSGIGSYMARALAMNGASKVFIIGRREGPLKSVADSVSTGNIIPVVGDVASKESLERCVEAVKRSGSTFIDVLIANAGVTGPAVPLLSGNQESLPLNDLAANLWKPEMDAVDATYRMNMTTVHFTLAAFLPLLQEANNLRLKPETAGSSSKPHPQIITTASISAYNRKPLENLSYGPSKAGVVHMMKQLTGVLAPYDIRANTIAPGFFLSELTQDMFEKQGKLEAYDVEGAWDRDVIPARRSGSEEDIAGVILFLCSRAGAYINGNVLVTDGGRLSMVPGSY